MEMNSKIIIYQTENGATKLEMRLEGETVWLTQAQMAELFGKSRSTITEHIQNTFREGELNEISVCRNFRHIATDGKTYDTQYYNLDVIIPWQFVTHPRSAFADLPLSTWKRVKRGFAGHSRIYHFGSGKESRGDLNCIQ